MQDIKNSEIKIEIQSGADYLDISKLSSDINVNFSIFNLSSTLTFQYDDLYNYDVTAGDVIRVTIKKVATKTITREKIYKIFSIRFIPSDKGDKEKMSYIVDCIDIHTFFLYRFIESKYYKGTITSILNQYIRQNWFDSGLDNSVSYPIKLDIDNSELYLDEHLSVKQKGVKEISDLLSYLKNYISYTSLGGLNFKDINLMLLENKTKNTTFTLNEKDKMNAQTFTYNIEYNFDMMNAYNYGMYGFNVYTWDKIKNKTTHYNRDRITIEPYDYLPIFKRWFQPNSLFNVGTLITLNIIDFFDIGDIIEYQSTKLDSKYNGKYMIIESDYSYIGNKLGFVYKLWKI